MGILLPENKEWSPANWVSRGLFEDLLEVGELPEAVAADARFCLDAELDTLDLRGASRDDLSALRRALEGVVRRAESRGPSSFQRPEYFPVYLAKLRELAGQLGGPLPGSFEEFPAGETLANGAFRIGPHLFGEGPDRVHRASADAGEAQYLVSSTSREASVAVVRAAMGQSIPGVFELVHVGTLDARGESAQERSLRLEHAAIVEQIPPGDSVRRLVVGAIPPAQAVALAMGTAAILHEAAVAGHLLVHVRPETIWAARDDDTLRVTGLSDRGPRFFRAAAAVCYTTAPAFPRRYTAPELILGRPATDRTLTFLVATMLAEWLGGEHPFPDAWTLRDPVSVAEGRHAPIAASGPLKALVERSLAVLPDDRPTLLDLIAALA